MIELNVPHHQIYRPPLPHIPSSTERRVPTESRYASTVKLELETSWTNQVPPLRSNAGIKQILIFLNTNQPQPLEAAFDRWCFGNSTILEDFESHVDRWPYLPSMRRCSHIAGNLAAINFIIINYEKRGVSIGCHAVVSSVLLRSKVCGNGKESTTCGETNSEPQSPGSGGRGSR